KAGGVPDVLALEAQGELGEDGDGAGSGVDPGLIRPEQQAQRQSRDERRAQVDGGQPPEARAERLCRERARDGEEARQVLRAEIEQGHVEDEERAERGDLEVTRVAERGCEQVLQRGASPLCGGSARDLRRCQESLPLWTGGDSTPSWAEIRRERRRNYGFSGI